MDMGMNTIMEMWVGINFESKNSTCNNDKDLLLSLPEDMFDENGHSWTNNECDKREKKQGYEKCEKKYGFVPKKFYCGNKCVGVGVSVFRYEWDYGVIPFNFFEFMIKARDIEYKIRRELDKVCRFGFTPDGIGVWLQTDYA